METDVLFGTFLTALFNRKYLFQTMSLGKRSGDAVEKSATVTEASENQSELPADPNQQSFHDNYIRVRI